MGYYFESRGESRTDSGCNMYLGIISRSIRILASTLDCSNTGGVEQSLDGGNLSSTFKVVWEPEE
jgi:hypothetical protein